MQRRKRYIIMLCGSLAAVAVATLLLIQWPPPQSEPTDTTAAQALWLHDPQAAFSRAAAEGRPIVIDFYADWCGPCKAMESTTFRDAAVIERLNDMVPLKVDVEQHGDLAERFGVMMPPTTVVTDSAGNPLASEVGYLDALQYTTLLSGIERLPH